MQLEMARRLAYAASRYGHVIFPTNAHEPVLKCTRSLLDGPGCGWATRAFYSDNGSTAIEVRGILCHNFKFEMLKVLISFFLLLTRSL